MRVATVAAWVTGVVAVWALGWGLLFLLRPGVIVRLNARMNWRASTDLTAYRRLAWLLLVGAAFLAVMTIQFAAMS